MWTFNPCTVCHPSAGMRWTPARYLHEAGATRRELAAVAVKSRCFAEHNEYAQMRHRITVEDVLDAPPIVEPLGLLDVPARSDGAVCVVVGRAQGTAAVEVVGRGYGHDGHHQMGGGAARHDRPGRREGCGNDRSGGRQCRSAGRWRVGTLRTLHDHRVLAAEAVGLLPRHRAAFAAAEGRTGPGGDVPINPSGGCLGRGHPSNITGLYQVLEAWLQLTERAGDRQIRTGHALTLAGAVTTIPRSPTCSGARREPRTRCTSAGPCPSTPRRAVSNRYHFEALDEGRLVTRWCGACRSFSFHRSIAAGYAAGVDVVWRELPVDGVLYASTTVHAVAEAFRPMPRCEWA